MRYSTAATVLVAFGLNVSFAVPSAFSAQAAKPGTNPGDIAATEGYSTGFHIVRPGENLRKITEAYLGSQDQWELNWELNPDVANPHFLLPGRRLKVRVRPEDSVPSAQVVSISGRVEGKPAPSDWSPAETDDLVVESDGMRTFEQSSTALRFHDGTSLLMTEDSIVFLKRAGRTLQGIETRSVEIVEGQADLAATGSLEGRPDIEFVIGDATASPRPDEAGLAEARLRKSPEGTAQLMVFEGQSELAAAGASVAVLEGMGASVPEGKPPLPPEKLLLEPSLATPEAGANLEAGSLGFAWEPVDGAVSYTAEICSDAACEVLVARAVGLDRPDWKPSELPLGNHFWRVTARSPSGLDGYPSDTRPFFVQPTRAEFEPPSATFSLAGISTENEKGIFHNAAVRVLVDVEDPSGVAGWEPLVDGLSKAKPVLQGGWTTGPHRVGVVAEDALGNRGETSEISFTVDGDAPELDWRIGGMELLEELSDRGELGSPRARGWISRAARRNQKRVRKNRPPVWTLIGWGNERLDRSETFEEPKWIKGLYQSYRGVRLTGDSPRMLLLAPGVMESAEATGEGGLFLAIDATDPMAGVEELSLRLVGSSRDGFRLEAIARDRLGNKSHRQWDFSPGSAY